MHEKPFAGVNGSGKHNNWSISTNTGTNLLNPGSQPHANMQFLTFLCAVIRAVDLHADLLRASIASAANDLRLGANEAPPAIISISVGAMIHTILDQIENDESYDVSKTVTLDLGAATMPKVNRDSGDRNRTSPFAFTGNKFEFRAVGSSAAIAWPNTVLNTIIAESLDFMATQLEKLLDEGISEEDRNTVVKAFLRQIIHDHRRIVYDGDNYAQEWYEEAAARGLPNLTTAAEAFPVLVSQKSLDLFEQYSVLSNRELRAREKVLIEKYATQVEIEARTMITMLSIQILPAALRYQHELAEQVAASHNVSVECTRTAGRLSDVAHLVDALQDGIEVLKSAVSMQHEDQHVHAIFIRDQLRPSMLDARLTSDQLEELIPQDLWPLPSYTEMLFIR